MNYATQYFMTHAIAVLFVCVLAEQSGLPIPSVPVLLAAGSQASTGRVSPIFSIAAALAACLMADSFWYQVGRRRRSKLLQESAQIAPPPRSWISRIVAACSRHQAGALLLAKFLPGPNLASPLAGISGLTRSRFLIFDSMASFVWAGGYETVGCFFSKRLQSVTAYGSHLAMAPLLVLFVAFVLAKLLRCRWSRWSRRAPVLVPVVLLCFASLAAGQGYSAGGGAASSSIVGSVPSGPATNGVLRVTLRDAKGDIKQAEAALRQRKAETENARGQLDYDVRTAFLNLNAAKEQVDVAQKNVALANENLARSRDRFTSGVTDSVEVVQSEQSLASANDQYITSVYNPHLAKLTLARAIGVARTSYSQYLGGK
jgi:membrane protein DedA with SNARE-associated domain